MFNFLQIFKIPDLRNKILLIVALLVVFRIFANIPIPGVDIDNLVSFFEGSQLLGFLDLFAGGGLSNLSIAMLGLGPYITATIIMQLLTMVYPRLKQLYYEEGNAGRAKFNRYSRYLTVPLAGLQSYGFLNLLISQNVLQPIGASSMIQNVVVIMAGSMFLVWLGEIITQQKLGNGVSFLIFAGIVAGLPNTVWQALINYSPAMLPTYVAFIVLSLVIVAGVVFVNQGERKVPVSYAKRVRGNKMFGGVSSFLPLKVNQAGVIPIIFAISILLFPQFIAQIASVFSTDLSVRLNEIVNGIMGNLFVYSALYFLLVVLFTYFYTAVTFDPKEISKNLQRSGGFIPGLRPGTSTAEFLSKIVNRITLSGAIFLGIVAVLPNITQIFTGIAALTIGGAALLIVVSVALETMRQIESQLVMREYEGFRS
ncbi:preprotein translocase subunit SecY [Candidatus Wolfebacteria bacterium RIFCSPLOWO2_01_FULL_45_19]|uniref:Protein translocase subunit SecY n=1 Tax=Candidatus Wolfebacteria bacterium RIFCSPLOWO2_01_FULL_45_19 TaxID=1802557 RepID=A0A1F8DSK6_9BACT|nr:MAG: Protein translocase subunit SecY [Parcubacteria group bacterium GW2011_GWB1_45_9]OGM91617.1 MAG: preprotein translocase subunit SecY [Candidatus Wolfebacteria bacterium RIFCSPLOWO2_01_FULL_45_19]